MSKPAPFTLSQLMFARLLKDTFQLYALVREPEQLPDEPAVLTESIPVQIGGKKSGRKRGGAE